MKIQSFLPQDQVFWYLDKKTCPPLTKNITTDVAIVGGGMAGLSAAQSLRQQGLSVVLLEKNYCGSGASGKSSGFITPDSELPLSYFVNTYGAQEGKRMWEFIVSGVSFIKKNIHDFTVHCDFSIQDTCIIANSKKKFASDVEQEYTVRQQLNYTSNLYTQVQIPQIIGSDNYSGAITYGDTFGINAYKYCIAMKHVLQDLGVRIYEETPAMGIQDHCITTPQGMVTADKIIICTDRFTEGISALSSTVYHAQTFLMVSSPLSDAQVKKIFPTKPLMVWDTDMVYHYYRITPDNRLLLGGGSLLQTYAKNESHNNHHMMQKLSRYFSTKFPQVNVSFEYIWPGLIGISKDFFPVAGFDKDMPSVYYIAAAAGLPWAAALGAHSADRIINNNISFDHYFSPYRTTKLGASVLGTCLETVLGKRLSFALSNLLTVRSL